MPRETIAPRGELCTHLPRIYHAFCAQHSGSQDGASLARRASSDQGSGTCCAGGVHPNGPSRRLANFTGLGSAGSENIRAAPIEDRGSPRAVKSGAADREGVDALQATVVSAINVATPVGGPEPKLISAVLTKVAANDLRIT